MAPGVTILEEFAEITRQQEALAPYTQLRVGGPAEFLASPRNRDELAALLRAGMAEDLPVHVIGNGSNVLVRDEGVRGIVLRLNAPCFCEIQVHATTLTAGAGAALSALISQAASHGLSGLETLIGIQGTVGGSLRRNVGDRSGEIGQFVRSVEVMDAQGAIHHRQRDELRFGPCRSNIEEPIILSAEFELYEDSADAIVKRMRKAWIQRKAGQPLSFQATCRLFKNPQGLSAASLIEQAGLAKTKVGGAEISERDANHVVAHPGTHARDVLRLIDLVRSRVREQFHVELEQDIAVW